MPTKVNRTGSVGSTVARVGSASTKRVTRTRASSYDKSEANYMTFNISYIVIEENDLIDGLNVIIVDCDRDASVLLPDNILYKYTIEIRNVMHGYNVNVYSGY